MPAHPTRILGILALGVAVAGCPPVRGPSTRTNPSGLPSVLWRTQLEGDPWPHGLVGSTLFVWNTRAADKGFLYPIQLGAHSPNDGKILWTSPVRPWLWDTGVPWSISLASVGGVVGTWEKGDVLRTLRLADGQDAWSLPRSRGLAVHQDALVTAGAGALWLLSAREGRTLARRRLPADPVLGPLALGDLVVLVLPGGRVIGMHPRTGERRWERVLPAGTEVGAMLVAGSTILVALRESEASRVGARLLAFQRGEPLWEATIPTSERPAKATALSSLHVAGDLVLWPDPAGRCMRAFELANGKERFRTCGLRVTSPAVRFGDVLYALGEDKKSEAALGRGEPWYSVDFPVLRIDATGGGSAPVLLEERRRRSKGPRGGLRPLRAARLPWAPPVDGVLYLMRRSRFLTAVRVGHPPASPGAGPAAPRP